MGLRNATRYGIAAERGKFTPMRIDFDARGNSTQHPLADAGTMSAAEAVLRPLGWLPYRERVQTNPKPNPEDLPK